MGKEYTNDGKSCFIITPFGEENSATFRKAKGVIDSVIKPVLIEFGFADVKPAYEINISGMINTQIINRIISDDLVIANLTDNNPNVMYELCLRHVTAKPIIHICQNGTSLPFDIKESRTIFYENDMLGVEELKSKLIKFMEEMDYSEECMDNPIYKAYKMGMLLKNAKNQEDADIIKLLMEIKDGVLGNQSHFHFSGTFNPITYDNNVALIDYNDLLQVNREALKHWLEVEEDVPENSDVHIFPMRVHELACDLNIKSATVIRLAQLAGAKHIKSAQSGVPLEDIKKIVMYIHDVLQEI